MHTLARRALNAAGVAALAVALAAVPATAEAACSSCLVIQNSSASAYNLNVAKDGPYTCADSRTPKGTLAPNEKTNTEFGWADAGCYYLFSGQMAYVYNVATGVQTGPIRTDGWHRLLDENTTKRVYLTNET